MRTTEVDLKGPSAAPLTATHSFDSRRLRVLIPMSGDGRRFKEAGYTLPKPLIDVNGKPMIQRVIENISLHTQYIFIVRKQHEDNFLLSRLLKRLCPGCQIVLTNVLTEGAACSTLLAKDLINNDDPLIIANGDQLVEWSPNEFISSMWESGAAGGILTFEADHPKWSYVRVVEAAVVQVAEKQVISNTATVGIYYYRKGSEYVRYAEQMIAKNIRVNGEFYVAPVFNEFISDGKCVMTYPCEEMYGLGTPEDLTEYLK